MLGLEGEPTGISLDTLGNQVSLSQLNLTTTDDGVLSFLELYFPSVDPGQNMPSEPVKKLEEKHPNAPAPRGFVFLHPPQGA